MAPEGSTIDQSAVETPPAQPAQPVQLAPGPQAPSQPAAKWEDDPRAKGILADLQRERRARQDYERKVAEHEGRLSEYQRQISALTNTKQPTKEEADSQAVLERLSQLHPVFAKLISGEIDLDKVASVAEQSNDLQEATINHWTNHSRGVLNTIHQEIAKEMGELTERQIKRINYLYVQEAENDPNFLARHNAGDPTLIKQFVKEYLDDTFEPARRKMTQTEVSRARPVPFGKDRSIPGEPDRKIDVNDPKAVMDLLMESRKGKFPR